MPKKRVDRGSDSLNPFLEDTPNEEPEVKSTQSDNGNPFVAQSNGGNPFLGIVCKCFETHLNIYIDSQDK